MPYFLLEDNTLKNLYFVLLAALLGGCSAVGLVTDSVRAVESQFTDSEKLTQQLRASQVNIVPLEDLTFRVLTLDNSNRIDITPKSQVANFTEGNSYVAALLLPERISRFTFHIQSITGKTVFVPSVIFLDDDFQEVARLSDAKLIDRKLMLEKTFDESMTNNVRYILVYSKDSDLDGKTELKDLVREYEESAGRSISEAAYPTPYTYHAPIGNINVTIKDAYFDANIAKKRKKREESPKQVVNSIQTVDILNDTEAFYLQQISKAVNEGNLPRAKSLTEEAVRAGSTKALPYYIDAISK